MGIIEKAYAKINLTIDVLGRRADGFHQLEMVMQTVSLADRLYLEDDQTISLSTQPALNIGEEENLVYQAAQKLAKRYNVKKGARMKLLKKIPVQAGLGGGSADAAAALRGLNRLWQLGCTYDELEDLAADLGSDVAFCIRGGTSFATGRGEMIERIQPPKDQEVLLVKPDFGIPTQFIYQSLDLVNHEPIYASRSLRGALNRADVCWWQTLHNDLQPVALKYYPALQTLITEISRLGGVVLMTGSGPTLVVFYQGKEMPKEVEKSLEGQNVEIFKTYFQPGLN